MRFVEEVASADVGFVKEVNPFTVCGIRFDDAGAFMLVGVVVDEEGVTLLVSPTAPANNSPGSNRAFAASKIIKNRLTSVLFTQSSPHLPTLAPLFGI